MIPALVEAALRALVVALTVWAGLRLLRVGNVLAQKTAWGLVLVVAVVMPLVMHWQWLPASAQLRLTAPTWRRAADSSPTASVAASGPAASSRSGVPSPVPAAALSSAPLQQFSAAPESTPSSGDRYPAPTVSSRQINPPARVSSPAPSPALADYPRRFLAPGASFRLLQPGILAGLVYFAVFATLLLRLMYGVVSATRLWLAAKPVSLEQSPDFFPPLRLRSSPAVSSPVTIGSGVLLPADYADWDAEKLRIVLAHERSHIRQGDFYLQMLAGAYATLFWFSPLGWWLKRKLSDLGEAISDRAGLEEAASPVSYAQVLLEFAAMPRPTLQGVAMARTSNLSHRIERLLNDSIFRQAFAGSRRRMLLAVLLVPVALFAATALIRVEAAETVPPASLQAPTSPPAQPPAPSPVAGQSMPDRVPDPVLVPDPALAPPPLPSQDQAPVVAPVPPVSSAAPIRPADTAPEPPTPPEPPDEDNTSVTIGKGQTLTMSSSNGQTVTRRNGQGRGYSYSYSSNGDSWALVTDPSDRVTFSGDWHNSTREQIDKARKLAHGKFLWFTHDGKSYFIDDQAQLAQIEAMYKPMEDLGRQQEELGRQQEVLGKQQEMLGRQQELASVPTPDISKEIAELNASVAKLQGKKGSTVTEEDLADIQGKIGDIQGRLGDIQGKIGEKQGALGEQQGKLGAQQGKLGAEQGRLGAQQGKIAAEADQKVKSIIQESLQNGKAHPVQ